MILPSSFYTRNTLTVAKDLLGKYLVFQVQKVRLAGRIVETEAYRGIEDKACHAAWRRRESCAALWGPAGYAYVYLTYGMYNMLNVVSEKDGFPSAVLIRALEPVEGLGVMRRNRWGRKDSPPPCRSQVEAGSDEGKSFLHLTSGPGKLTQAFGITNKNHNGLDVTHGRILWLEDRGDKIKNSDVAAGTRIGVDYAGDWAKKPWRFYLRDSPYVSRK